MLDVFYKSNRAEGVTVLKVLRIILIISLALMIALMPAVRVLASTVGTIVGILMGTAAFTVLSEAGVALVVAIVVGMGLKITVQMLYDYFDDPERSAEFLAAWDNWRANHNFAQNGSTVSLSGQAFRALYAIIKSYIVDSFETTVAPDLNGGTPLLNPIVMPSDYSGSAKDWVNSQPDDYKAFYNAAGINGSTILNCENSITGWNSSIEVKNVSKQLWLFYSDDNYNIKIKALNMEFFNYYGKIVTIMYPYVNGTTLYLANGNAEMQNGSPKFRTGDCLRVNFPSNESAAGTYFTNNSNPEVSADDVRIWYQTGTSDYYHQVYFSVDGVKHYYRLDFPDGTSRSVFDTFGSFFYYLLCTECELIDTYDESSVGSSIGQASSTVNEYYTTKSDIYYNYYTQVAAVEAAGTLATGTDSDVKISTAALTSSVAMTDTLTDTAVVTDVQSAVETTTGEVISVSPSITCMNGINLIRVSSGSIRDKFPFAVVYVLRDSLNVFAGTRETPVFTVPIYFNLPNVINYTHQFTVDLTELNGIAAIFRWGEIGLLVIGLAFATKKLLF